MSCMLKKAFTRFTAASRASQYKLNVVRYALEAQLVRLFVTNRLLNTHNLVGDKKAVMF